MDIGPQTTREKLIAEAAHAQGYQDGVNATLAILQKRNINYAHGFEDGTRAVIEGVIKRDLVTLAATRTEE